jgi:hypothetical protein
LGLHPDQPSEALVDTALTLGRPFMIVPCCVFPTLFPERRLVTGQSVRTYRGFVQYLRAKHPAIEVARLPFEGRNKVLFWRGGRSSTTHGREEPRDDGVEACAFNNDEPVVMACEPCV